MSSKQARTTRQEDSAAFVRQSQYLCGGRDHYYYYGRITASGAAALVLVAVEKRGRATGRARMAVIPDFKSVTLVAFLKQNVASGSTLYTDMGVSRDQLQVYLDEFVFRHNRRPIPIGASWSVAH